MNDNFEKRWLRRFGLSAGIWRTEVRAHLRELPFSEPRQAERLVGTLFGRVPALLARRRDGETGVIAEAYGWCCFSFWQCGSAFPAFPESYAEFLKVELFKANSKRLPECALLARMLVVFNAGEGECGFNKLALGNPVAVRNSEHCVHEGGYEVFLKAKEKYAEYEFYLRELPDLRREWTALKTAFPKETRRRGVAHRTLLPERNWERGAGARFDTRAQRFQAAFDLFCWKYFLWGMKRDKPLLMKPSVVFTPLGTQIFIPGYLSLDGKRDLDFARINKMHKARGLPRQGQGFSTGRLDTANRKKRARALDEQAKQMGLKGRARYAFIAQKLRMADGEDFRGVRKLLTGADNARQID